MTDQNRRNRRPDVRASLRRRVDGSPLVQRVAKRAVNDRPQVERLLTMYDRLRARYTDLAPVAAPTPHQIARVEQAALTGRQQDAFLSALVAHGDVARAAVALVTALVRTGAIGRARTAAQAFQVQDGLTHAGDTAQAVIALHDGAPGKAWELLARHEPRRVVPLAPAPYFRAAFAQEPNTARRVLERVRTGELSIDAEPAEWLDLARAAFVGGAEQQAGWCLERAERDLVAVTVPARRAAIRAEIDWLRPWLARAVAARHALRPPAGEIAFGVVDYKQPDRSRTSTNLGDPVQTLASLGHLVRRAGVRFTGDAELADLATELADRVAPDRVVTGPPAVLRLYPVDRDASTLSGVPDGTWMFAFGWLMHSQFRMRFDLPLNPSVRPIFVSLHVNDPGVLSDDAIDYLRRYGPVGCRDWNTVHLLRAARVPAFFSGCITSTIDTLFPPVVGAQPSGTVYVDTPATGPGDTFAQEFDEVRRRSLAPNLRDALARVQTYRDHYADVVTSRLHCYLPARSIGASVQFRPKNPANVRFDGLAGISDADFAAMRTGILDKLDAVLTAITEGCSEDEVYATWRRLCAPDVERAEQRAAAIGDIAVPSMDVAGAVAAVRGRAVLMERSEPAAAGEEIHVEFSLDGNLRQQLAVVLDSIVSRTERPVRAHILCRDHGQEDYARLAQLFPSVSFEWLPMDHVDYGRITGMIGHVTVATMDRLLLPDLLPGVGRIVHHDLDALCLADLGELYDLDLHGRPLAARTSPHPQFLSGFREFIRSATRLTQDQAKARELVARTHTRHGFDFDIFNAGIMVLDLDRMRADGFGRHYLPYVERFGLNDQAVLNAYAGADRVELAAGWNWHPRLELASELADGPKIAHWAGPLKPWGPSWVNGQELWRAAQQRLDQRRQAARTPLATAPAR